MKLNRVLLIFVINGRGGFDYLKEMMKKAELNIIISLFFLVFFVSAISGAESSIEEQAHVKRSDFPPGFLFGASTSAYQVEGAFHEDGKSLSNWDVFCHSEGNVVDGSNAEIADDHYHRFMEDVEIMASLGLSAYRLSISWSRVLPRGRLGAVNQVGIEFYSKIIDNLLRRGIQPFVTLFHFEFPQELEDRFGGWLSPLMQDEFVYFAEVCFRNFGDRVKYWMTFNEVNLYAEFAYERNYFPPLRCSPPFGDCAAGNSDVEPLIVAHNMLLAHARAAKLYHEEFKSKVDGLLGITVSAFMYTPMTDDENDKEAANRALAFNVAWTLDPVVYGDYPPEMRRIHGNELPRFTSEESLLLSKSIDFIGINHYGSLYAKDCIHSSCICNDNSCSPGSDRAVRGYVYTTGEHDGVPIGQLTGMARFYVVPRGMEDIVDYVKERYNNMPMFVTENGYSSPVGENESFQHDVGRIQFHQSYLAYLSQAIRKGGDVRGYFVWSLMDNFEWANGLGIKFGLYQIVHPSLERVPKLSAIWYTDFLSNNSTISSSYAEDGDASWASI